jgi:hypothetical protein
LWHDDFYYHSMLQKRLQTPICLDESIRNRRDALAAIEMESCRIINIKLGRVGGFSEAIAVHNAAQERGIPVWCGGMLESGVGRAHNIALSTLENFTLPGDVSASARYWAEDIIEPEVTVSAAGEIAIPDTPAAATRCAPIWLERLTVRKETIRAFRRQSGNPRTNVIANPLHAKAALFAGKNVKANFGPVVDALGDLDGFVFGVISGGHAVDGLAVAVGGEVRVQFDHGAAGSNRLRAVDLNLVVALSARLGRLRRRLCRSSSATARSKAILGQQQESRLGSTTLRSKRSLREYCPASGIA